MITKKEVQHTANLARIGVTEAEIEKFQKDISSVLAYVDKLKKLDLAGVEPTSHPVKIENVTRKDEAKPWPQRLLPGFLKVKSIFNGSN
ncbi:MAG: Asp-tRNA(Asn)/Glu-tRNA(Gln) amidotransferase subunit GatC [bacterium]|nr:Asp-tRNA(Asn)/Glu-tRNA(Gln) amidotransferase subunit GatC [bacterium]